MNILQIIPALESGGVETGTIDLSLSLKKLGQTVVVVSSGGRMVKELENNGILHIKLPVHKKSPTSLFVIPKVAQVIKTHKIDVVHASSRLPAWIAFLACKVTKTVFVTSCHGFYSKHFFSSIMARGKLVMVISKTIEKRMTEDFGVPKKKIRLIYRGLDLSRYDYLQDKYDKRSAMPIVLNIGRLTPIKGQYGFIKAMKHVTDKNKNVEAWIIGGVQKGKENYFDRLQALVKELALEKNIRFFGLKSNVPKLLKKGDCLVLSTNVPEGFGRTLIEAGAVGTVTCASNTGGIPEIIDDGISGILFPPGNDIKMAEGILKLLENPGLSKTLAQNLRKKVEQNFTLTQMAESTLSVYKEAILH